MWVSMCVSVCLSVWYVLHTTFKITESNSPGWRAGVWTQVLLGSQQGARPEPATSAAQDALLTRPFLAAGGGGALGPLPRVPAHPQSGQAPVSPGAAGSSPSCVPASVP